MTFRINKRNFDDGCIFISGCFALLVGPCLCSMKLSDTFALEEVRSTFICSAISMHLRGSGLNHSYDLKRECMIMKNVKEQFFEKVRAALNSTTMRCTQAQDEKETSGPRKRARRSDGAGKDNALKNNTQGCVLVSARGVEHADINAQNELGETALHLAAVKNLPEMWYETKREG
eukprot:753712-Hanusia_phi.AAC.5